MMTCGTWAWAILVRQTPIAISNNRLFIDRILEAFSSGVGALRCFHGVFKTPDPLQKFRRLFLKLAGLFPERFVFGFELLRACDEMWQKRAQVQHPEVVQHLSVTDFFADRVDHLGEDLLDFLRDETCERTIYAAMLTTVSGRVFERNRPQCGEL